MEVREFERDERWERGMRDGREGCEMGGRDKDGKGRVGGGGPPISISLSHLSLSSPSPLLITCMLRLDTLLRRDLSWGGSS